MRDMAEKERRPRGVGIYKDTGKVELGREIPEMRGTREKL